MSRIEEALRKAQQDRVAEQPAAEQHEQPLLARGGLEPQTPNIIGEIDQHIIAHYEPTAPAAEYLRRIRTKLKFMRELTPFKSLAVTSCRRGEGKSTIAVNLAITLSYEPGAKVLLVDTDLRKPSIVKMLGLECPHGLGEFLESKTGDENIPLYTTPIERLTLLPAGAGSPNPAELLGSERFKKLLAVLSARYDWIILDTPPLLPVTDTQVLSGVVDRLVLIIEAFRTSRAAIQQAMELIPAGKMLGCILNKLEHEMTSYYRYPYHKHE